MREGGEDGLPCHDGGMVGKSGWVEGKNSAIKFEISHEKPVLVDPCSSVRPPRYLFTMAKSKDKERASKKRKLSALKETEEIIYPKPEPEPIQEDEPELEPEPIEKDGEDDEEGEEFAAAEVPEVEVPEVTMQVDSQESESSSSESTVSESSSDQEESDSEVEDETPAQQKVPSPPPSAPLSPMR
jgi:hypothetical protein